MSSGDLNWVRSGAWQLQTGQVGTLASKKQFFCPGSSPCPQTVEPWWKQISGTIRKWQHHCLSHPDTRQTLFVQNKIWGTSHCPRGDGEWAGGTAGLGQNAGLGSMCLRQELLLAISRAQDRDWKRDHGPRIGVGVGKNQVRTG